jgi:DNA-directed RNA polymerase subunit RPC12/RpoP
MEEKFKTVAIFQYSTEAQIIKGKLESEGIKVFITDNFTIDTDPLVSQAIGGVKLKVLAEQEAKAIKILKEINEYSLDDEGRAILCPNCKSDKVEFSSTIKDIKSLISFVFGLFIGLLPFYIKRKYRCDDCKTEFDLK